MLYLGSKKVGIAIGKIPTEEEDISPEITTQKELLDTLEDKVDNLSDKPKGVMQLMIDNTNSCDYLFDYYNGASLDFVTQLDTSNAVSSRYMFNKCENVEVLNLGSLDFSNVVDAYSMFGDCQKLEELILPNFRSGALTTAGRMFAGCPKLARVNWENFNSSNIEDMNSMFIGSLTGNVSFPSEFKTNNATSMRNMFYGSRAETIDLSNFETGKVLDMNALFFQCPNLTSVNLSGFDVRKVRDFSYMFRGCPKIKQIDLSSFEFASTALSVSSMFDGCVLLESIIGELNVYYASSFSSMFSNCSSLKNLTLKNIRKTITLGSGTSYGTLLTNESLINTIKELWDLTGSSTQTLTLSTTSKENIANIYVKLITPTQEQIDADPYINNKKPCVVCESTDAGAMTLTEYATSKNWAIA